MNKARPAPTVISATQLQREAGKILLRSHKHGEHFIVERAGFPVVVILPLKDYPATTHSASVSKRPIASCA